MTKRSSRHILVRVFKIASVIRAAKRPVTAFKLGVALDVDGKTIQRDLEVLRHLGAPVYYEHSLHTWVWSQHPTVPWYFGGTNEHPQIGRSIL